MAERQVPFATSRAINFVAGEAKENLRAEMAKVFERPRPFTLNSLFVKAATKSTLTATVGHKDRITSGTPAAQYLQAEILGGSRAQTPFEKLIQSISGERAVPTPSAKRDLFGGVRKSVRMDIIKGLEARNGKDPRGVFLIAPGSSSHLAPGIYQRQPNRVRIKYSALAGRKTARGGGTRLKTLYLFKPQASYSPIYDLLGTVNRTIAQSFDAAFARSMDEALRTAKVSL